MPTNTELSDALAKALLTNPEWRRKGQPRARPAMSASERLCGFLAVTSPALPVSGRR
jgi:hypothetical protein